MSLDVTRRQNNLVLRVRSHPANRLNEAHFLYRMRQWWGSQVFLPVLRTVATPRGALFIPLLTMLSLSTPPFPIFTFFFPELPRLLRLLPLFLLPLLACDAHASSRKRVYRCRFTPGLGTLLLWLYKGHLFSHFIYDKLNLGHFKVDPRDTGQSQCHTLLRPMILAIHSLRHCTAIVISYQISLSCAYLLQFLHPLQLLLSQLLELPSKGEFPPRYFLYLSKGDLPPLYSP